MSNPTLSDLAANVEKQFLAALGFGFGVNLRELSGESHYRGGFRLVFAQALREVTVSYGDLEFEVTENGCELFGPSLHEGFEGNMFSREHLEKCLPRIAASAIAQLRVAG